MVDSAQYLDPVQYDWDPNNHYDGTSNSWQSYAGYGPSGGAAATSTPTDAYIIQNNGYNPANGPVSYPQAQPVDPYQMGLNNLSSTIGQQTRNYQSQYQPYVDATAANYYGGASARQGVLDQQSGYLNQFSQADASAYNNLSQANAGYNAAGNQAVGNLQDLNGSMRQLTAGGYGADVVANPDDLARQEAAYDTYGGFASGQYDYTSQAAQAYADPEAVAAQKEVMAKLKGEMDPKLTDAERYLYMQARLQEEQSNRGARDANLRELERSGMSGSTMALSNLNATSQQTATTRALADLGANAKAIDRSTQATRDYGNLASVVSGQSFQQAYGRGQAADAASQFNTQTRLQGAVAQGNQANQMRTANDALNTFNKAQSLQQQRFQDQYAADQQNAAWGRGTDITNAQLQNVGQQRQSTTAQTQIGAQMNSDWLRGSQNLGDQQLTAARDNTTSLGVAGDALSNQINIGATGDRSKNALVEEGLRSAREDKQALDAQKAAADEAERQRKYNSKPHSVKDVLEFKGVFG